MISRVADHCFWLGRYLERAENIARVLSATRTLALDAELPPRQCWGPVVTVSGEEEAFAKRFGAEANADGEVVESYLTWDEENFTSLRASVAALRDNARSIRDVVSLEAWEPMNELHLWLLGPAARSEYAQHRFGFYSRIRQATQLALGLMRSTMLHDLGLDFIWLGVMLERGSQTARMLDVHHHGLEGQATSKVVETALWLATLRACSGFEPFMKRARGQISGLAIASFLICEPRFPRSLRYCLSAAHQRLAAIRPANQRELPGGQTLERLRILDEWIRGVTVEGANLHDLLTHVVDETAAVCDGLGRELFGTPPPLARKSD